MVQYVFNPFTNQLDAVNSMVIGTAEDGDYTDGLFTDFVVGTPIGTAIDRFNEVLNSLAPNPAPVLGSITIDTAGTNGRLSFDNSNPIAETPYSGVDGIGNLSAVDIDEDFNDTGNRAGIINASTDIAGTLNNYVTANGSSYPADSFGNGDVGSLFLELNGSIARGIDLSTAGSVNDGTSATGFNISPAIATKFSNGDSFNQFKWRSGTFRVDSSDMLKGWNYVRIIHSGTSFEYVTDYTDWVVDANAVSTSFSSEFLGSLGMQGSKFLAGINYYTAGSAKYGITIDNAYRNTYVASNAVTFNETNISSLSNESLSASAGDELKQHIVSAKATTINATRLINGSIANSTSLNRTVQSDLTSTGAAIGSILMDNATSSSTQNTLEDFISESFRVTSNSDFDDTATVALWSGITTLVNTGSAGYNDGLMIQNGYLRYPSGNWSPIANGPAGNPNYNTGITGSRYYYRIFTRPSGASSTFRMNLDGAGTFCSGTTTLTNGGSHIKIHIKLPSQTGWMDCFTDFATGQWNDNDGCRDTSQGNAGRNFNNWDLSVGTKSTADSDDKVFLRILVGSAWTGSISNLAWTFN